MRGGLSLSRDRSLDEDVIWPALTSCRLARAASIIAPILGATFVAALPRRWRSAAGILEPALAPEFSQAQSRRRASAACSRRAAWSSSARARQGARRGRSIACGAAHGHDAADAGPVVRAAARRHRPLRRARRLLAAGAVLGLVLIAAIDVPFQLWQHTQQLQDDAPGGREELKETEGTPETGAASARCSARWRAAA